MIKKLSVVFILVIVLFVIFFVTRIHYLKTDLSSAQNALDTQIVENAKSLSIFESKINQNNAASVAIINKLNQRIDFEEKRAEAANFAAERAVLESKQTADHYKKTINQLSVILNEKNNACVRDPLPADVLEWVQSFTH